MPRETPNSSASPAHHRAIVGAFAAGALIGALGGLIGLGGAEFRLPLLITVFGFQGLEAVVLNKVASLIVVTSALPFRAGTVPFSAIYENWTTILNLLAGSVIGAWVGADGATRLKSATLYRVMAVLLIAIAAALLFVHDTEAGAPWTGWPRWWLVSRQASASGS